MLERQNETGVGYLEETLLPARPDDALELDAGALWADGVTCKTKERWCGFGLRCAAAPVKSWHGTLVPVTRSVVYRCGTLWHKIPADYKALMCYSDFWDSYQKVIPAEQHQACGKEEGQTNHVERFNLTLRNRGGRLVRKTLSFSKELIWHLRHLRFFLVHYNIYCIERFNPH